MDTTVTHCKRRVGHVPPLLTGTRVRNQENLGVIPFDSLLAASLPPLPSTPAYSRHSIPGHFWTHHFALTNLILPSSSVSQLQYPNTGRILSTPDTNPRARTGEHLGFELTALLPLSGKLQKQQSRCVIRIRTESCSRPPVTRSPSYLSNHPEVTPRRSEDTFLL